MSSPRQYSQNAVLALLAAVVFTAVVNGTMVNIALPYIGQDFNVSEGTYGWIVTGYSLTFGIFNAIDGRLADVVGMKRLYMFGLLIFGIGSLAVALSPSIEVAIGLRLAQGAGAAALPVLGSSIIARIVAADRRGAAMGVIMSTVGVAASIGPFLGGILVQFGGWRLCLAASSVVLLAIPFAWRLLPSTLDETEARHFDFIGAALLAGSVSVGMYGFTVLENEGFGLALVLCEVVAVLFAIAFGWWIRRAREPFAHPQLFTNVRYLATSFIAFVCNATRFGTVVLVPIVLTVVHKEEPLMIGLVLFPGALAIAFLSRRAGKLADRFGPRRPVAVGTIFILLGNLVAAVFTGTSALGISVGMLLYGIGFANIHTPLVSTVPQLVPSSRIGVGMGMFMMIFFVGGAFGTAVSVMAVELQAVDATSWLGLDLGLGARYSNGILVLNVLALLGIFLVRLLPHGRFDARPVEVVPHTV